MRCLVRSKGATAVLQSGQTSINHKSPSGSRELAGGPWVVPCVCLGSGRLIRGGNEAPVPTMRQYRATLGCVAGERSRTRVQRPPRRHVNLLIATPQTFPRRHAAQLDDPRTWRDVGDCHLRLALSRSAFLAHHTDVESKARADLRCAAARFLASRRSNFT